MYHSLNFCLSLGPTWTTWTPRPSRGKGKGLCHPTSVLLQLLVMESYSSSESFLFVFQGELGLPGPAGVDGEKVWWQRGRNYTHAD